MRRICELKDYMKHKISHFLFCAILSSALTVGTAAANDSLHEPSVSLSPMTPAPFSARLNLEPSETHSGLRLPRWVSLKYGQVNGRKGPGKS